MLWQYGDILLDESGAEPFPLDKAFSYPARETLEAMVSGSMPPFGQGTVETPRKAHS